METVNVKRWWCSRGDGTVQWDGRRPPGCCDTEDVPEGTSWASADLQAVQRHCKLLLYVTIAAFLHWNPFNLRGYLIWPGLYFKTYPGGNVMFLWIYLSWGLKKLRLMALFVFLLTPSCSQRRSGDRYEGTGWISARRELWITSISHHLPCSGTAHT